VLDVLAAAAMAADSVVPGSTSLCSAIAGFFVMPGSTRHPSQFAGEYIRKPARLAVEVLAGQEKIAARGPQ
jgi:hypothetical protein